MSPLLISLPERATRILAHLLQAEGPMTTTELGAQLGLSYAQVRYCFRYLEAWLHERSLLLQKTPRVGVYIEAEAATRRKLLNEIRAPEAGQLLLTKDERIRLLVLRLLLAHTPLSVGTLRRQLGMSRSSLFRDLAEARKWLKERGLCVRTRRGKGVLAQEPEACWRDAMVELLLTHLDEGTLIAHCVLPPSDATAPAVERPPFVQEACDFLGTLDLAQVERLVVELETILGGILVDEAHMQLVLHVGLVVHRVQMGRCVGEDGPGCPWITSCCRNRAAAGRDPWPVFAPL
jgi:activator of the mannose operon (transcriptional antiterminator)